MLAERAGLGDHGGRQFEAAGAVAGGAPQQEGSQGTVVMGVVLGVPPVDLGLAARVEGESVFGEPGQEAGGGLDLAAGEAAAGRDDRFVLGAFAHPGQDLPGRVSLDDPGVLGVADGGQVADQPALERTDLLVDLREGAAVHQQLAHVGGGPPGLEGVEGRRRRRGARRVCPERAAGA